MKNRLCVLAVLALLLAVVVVLPIPAFAQTSNGTIAGTIVDKSGAGITDANVEITSDDRGGEPRLATTDASGAFRAEALTPGKYTVTVIKKTGFADIKISGLDVKASLTMTSNGRLKWLAQAATVLVEATKPKNSKHNPAT